MYIVAKSNAIQNSYSLPQERDESFFQSLQFETFDKYVDGEAFLRHESLDTLGVNQPRNNIM